MGGKHVGGKHVGGKHVGGKHVGGKYDFAAACCLLAACEMMFWTILEIEMLLI